MFYRVLHGIRDRQQARSVGHSPLNQDRTRWELLESTRGRVSDVSAEDWSMSGFEEEVQLSTLTPTAENQAPENLRGGNDDEASTDEGIFDMDL